MTVYLIPDGAENVIREMAREGDLYGISQPCICSDDIPRGYVESNHAANYAFCLNQNFRIYHSYEIAEHEGLNRLVSHFASQLSTKRFTIALKQLRTYLFDVQHEKISAVQFIEAIEIIRKTVIDSYGKMVPEEERELIHWELPVTRSSEFMQCLETWLETYRYYILLDLEGNQKIQKAIDYMKEHYTENLNMAIVSNYVSMNYSQFSVEFKKYTGESFVTYLKKIRIEEAKRLLVETNLKIAALALRAGFHDEKHFMKVFRTEVGVTPTEYRKNRELSLESGKNKL